MNDQERKEFEQNEQGFENQPEQPMVDVNAQAYANQGFFENQPAPQGDFGYQPNANGGFAPEMMGAPQQNGRGKFFGLGVTSMILGIISILFCCCEGIFIVSAVTAIVFAGIRMSKKPDGFAVAGLVTGIIGLILNTLFLLLAGVFTGLFALTLEEVETLSESVANVIKLFIIK